MHSMHCPQCKSKEVTLVTYLSIQCVVCTACGYDERSQYEVYPGEKSSPRQKGGFSPYQAGGQHRISKAAVKK